MKTLSSLLLLPLLIASCGEGGESGATRSKDATPQQSDEAHVALKRAVNHIRGTAEFQAIPEAWIDTTLYGDGKAMLHEEHGVYLQGKHASINVKGGLANANIDVLTKVGSNEVKRTFFLTMNLIDERWQKKRLVVGDAAPIEKVK